MRFAYIPGGRMLVLTVVCVVVSGCLGTSLPRVYPDKPDPRSGERAIELFDANKDGFLDAAELEKVPGLKAALHQVDANKDGKITAAEITARIKSWADSKLGRMAVSCTVTRNGQPLVGALVKFLPEKFLGDALKAAEGTTDAQGFARLTVPNSGPRGISPGFYRIEITKSEQKIPPKYNSETQLGQEIAVDAAGLNNGVASIDLKY